MEDAKIMSFYCDQARGDDFRGTLIQTDADYLVSISLLTWYSYVIVTAMRGARGGETSYDTLIRVCERAIVALRPFHQRFHRLGG